MRPFPPPLSGVFRLPCALWLATVLSASTLPAVDRPAFVERASEVGLDFRHFNGMVGKLYFAEHMGGGVALVDHDGDGDLDVYFGQGAMLDDSDPSAAVFPTDYPLPLTDRLYRNDLERGEGLHFTDVTEAARLAAHGYNMGVATGDYDNDGDVDLYVTNLGSNQLLRNRGDGTFEDVTEAAGADDRRWSVPASFFDYDGDGWLDLFVGNYVEFRVALHKNCASPMGAFDYCGPQAYEPEPNRLLRNRGDGTFEDTTARSGMGVAGATLGAIAADLDGDSRLDLYVANDLMANEMWINQGDGTFVDDALFMGSAVDKNGQPQASMGVLADDLDGDGDVDLFMSHLDRETNTLYLNDGSGMFTDATGPSGLGEASFHFTGFGTAMLDHDGDGVLDLFVVNGAVRRLDEQVKADDPHPLKQTDQLFRGLGGGRFEEVPAERRVDVVHAEVSRGLAAGDLDNDGDTDLVVVNNGGPARLLLNTRDPEHWLGLRVLGREGRDAYGALVEVAESAPGGRVQKARVHTDGSYASARDPRVLFALAAGERVTVTVTWPDGERERFAELETAAYRTLERGKGAPVTGTPPG